MNSPFQSQMEQQNFQEETTNSENPLTPRREHTARSEDLSGEVQGESEESQLAESADDAEARANFWSIEGDFVCRHPSEPRVQLHGPKEESFLIPVKYMDVHADLHAMQEKRVDDDWNVDANRSLSDSWKGFTKFTLCGPG